MRAREEALCRIALKRRTRLNPLSDEAFAELQLAVREDPQSFVEDDSERALLALAEVLDANSAALEGEEFLDDDAYEVAHARRIGALAAGCHAALEIDAGCLDAAAILALQNDDAGETLEELVALDTQADGPAPGSGMPQDRNVASGGKAAALAVKLDGSATESLNWEQIFDRPRLRLRAAIARSYLDTTRFVAAREACTQLVGHTCADPLGARNTWALACARLEDEQGFNELDVQFGRRGNAWLHLARVLLMFKLDRMASARRALRGYQHLCEGGAYALLRPSYVDAYLPDRPACAAGSFEEAILAVHEADPVVVDTPDFITWCSAQEDFSADARHFAEDHDLDW